MNKTVATISYILSGIFLIVGFNKMFVYVYHDLDFMRKNAYVGGDAYNYIINSNYATAWFVLAIGLAILGTLFLIKESIENNLIKTDEKQDEQKSEEEQEEVQKEVNCYKYI